MKYREMYLVEKCLNHLTNQYIESKMDGYHSAKQDYCIDFINFLNENDKECVDYGIQYVCENYKDVVDEVLLPILAEYKYSGTSGNLHWDPIPEKDEQWVTDPMNERNVITPETTECVQEIKRYNIDVDKCSPKEKILLFVMKLLKL